MKCLVGGTGLSALNQTEERAGAVSNPAPSFLNNRTSAGDNRQRLSSLRCGPLDRLDGSEGGGLAGPVADRDVKLDRLVCLRVAFNELALAKMISREATMGVGGSGPILGFVLCDE